MVEPMLTDKGEQMEPALHFHEFVFLLGLIAKNCIGSDSPEKNMTIQDKLQYFYTKTLKFKEVKLYSYDEIIQIKEFKVKDDSKDKDKEIGRNEKDKDYLRRTLQDIAYEDVLKMQSGE